MMGEKEDAGIGASDAGWRRCKRSTDQGGRWRRGSNKTKPPGTARQVWTLLAKLGRLTHRSQLCLGLGKVCCNVAGPMILVSLLLVRPAPVVT
jgi:hypothetical protein